MVDTSPPLQIFEDANPLIDPTKVDQPAPVQPSVLDRYRAENPQYANTDDYQLSRALYNDGHNNVLESYPAFADRLGVSQSPMATLANKGLTTAAFGLNNPLEAGLSGLGSALTGGSFGDAYKAKQQELADQDAIGRAQNPLSNAAGDAAGTVADYMRFGPMFRKGLDYVPGVAKLTGSGPLGDSIAKFFGLGAANEIPKMLEKQAVEADTSKPNYGFTPGQDALDVLEAGAGGAGAAMLGHGISTGLGAVVGPILQGTGGGLIAIDNALKGLPRSVYTRAATKMGAGYTGANNPASSALNLDQEFYDRLLSQGSLSVSKGVDQLGNLMDKPGYASRILEAAKSSIDTIPDTSAGALATPTNGAAAIPGAELPINPAAEPFHIALDNINNGALSGVEMGKAAIAKTVVRLNASDPTGQDARTFIANIYKDLIPQRLAGPFDPDADFQRNLISGSLSDKGQIIPPPFTGLSALSQQRWERMGGGPGSVMWPMPKSFVPGTLSVVGNLPAMAGRGVGNALDQLGQGASSLATPGQTAADIAGKLAPKLLGSDFATRAGVALHDAPGFYQTRLDHPDDMQSPASFPPLPTFHHLSDLFPSLVSPNPHSMPQPDLHQPTMYEKLFGQGSFPDTYTPQSNQQHAEMPSGADVQNWLGSTDRGSATNLVAQRLGPDVAKQLAATDDNGYRAAIFNLSVDPNYRKQLASSPLPDNEGGAGDLG